MNSVKITATHKRVTVTFRLRSADVGSHLDIACGSLKPTVLYVDTLWGGELLCAQ